MLSNYPETQNQNLLILISESDFLAQIFLDPLSRIKMNQEFFSKILLFVNCEIEILFGSQCFDHLSAFCDCHYTVLQRQSAVTM